MKKMVAGLTLGLSVGAPGWACDSDVDCKGDRVCVQKACVDPTPASAPAPDHVQRAAPGPVVPEAPPPAPVRAALPVPATTLSWRSSWHDFRTTAVAMHDAQIDRTLKVRRDLLISGGVLLGVGVIAGTVGAAEMAGIYSFPPDWTPLAAGGAGVAVVGAIVMGCEAIPRMVVKARVLKSAGVAFVPGPDRHMVTFSATF